MYILGQVERNKIYFTKKDSTAIKGIAILMMLWHHCFMAGWFDEYSLIFSLNKSTLIFNLP